MASDRASSRDIWLEWLEHRRAPNTEQAEASNAGLAAIRDHLLELAAIEEGEIVLDVGTGTGLIAFGALERTGPEGRVIFSDISQDCLDHCRARAEQERITPFCSFVAAGIEDMSAIEDESVDVVTMRSVLIYTKQKEQAFAEFHRVLRPGGRLVFFEPINSFNSDGTRKLFRGYEFEPVADLVAKVRRAIEEHQPVEGSPMLDFDERDLIRMAQGAGFAELKLEYNAGIGKAPPSTWSFFYETAPNPLALTMEEAVARALDPEEAERFVAYFRPLVETTSPTIRRAYVYMAAHSVTVPLAQSSRRIAKPMAS